MENMKFKMQLCRMGNNKHLIKPERVGDKLRLSGLLRCEVSSDELGSLGKGDAGKLIARGEMTGDWLVSLKGWKVQGRPSIAMSPGGADIACRIVQEDPCLFFLTQGGIKEAKATAVTKGAEVEIEAQYRRQVNAGRDLVFQLLEVAEAEDTEWEITLQPGSVAPAELPFAPRPKAPVDPNPDEVDGLDEHSSGTDLPN